MVPFSEFAMPKWGDGSPKLERYKECRVEILGEPSAGVTAPAKRLDAMEGYVKKVAAGL